MEVAMLRKIAAIGLLLAVAAIVKPARSF